MVAFLPFVVPVRLPVRLLVLLPVLLLVDLLAAAACSPARPADVEWPVNGGPDNIRYTQLSQITPANVSQLRVAWTYDARDAFDGSEMQSNPIVVGGVLYATTPTMNVVALDAATGREKWRFDPSGGSAARTRFRQRGVTVHGDRVFVTYRNDLFALDTETGRPIDGFGRHGRVDLREGFDRPVDRVSISASSPGQVFEDLLIMGSTVPETLPGTPGDIRAFDVRTGQIRWTFHTIPRPGEFAYDTWPKDAYKIVGGANAWAGVTVDPSTGMVFAATGSASFDFYGVNRHGDNLFADCVLALDARTGRRIWHFQGIKHDVWDWDFPAAPSLVTVTRNGRRVPAVAQTTKYGYVYVLDRKTGEPLFPIEYRSVPASPVAGEELATRQPYPLAPPRFSRASSSSRPGCSPPPPSAAPSCFRVSTAGPSGAAPRSIPTPGCSTSTRTRCRGSCG
jgi:quinoprotein glucose dehydrogenase